MCNNRYRYNIEREQRWGMARNGEEPAIKALVQRINNRFCDSIVPQRYDDMWFRIYNPENIQWVRGCSDYYLDILSNGNYRTYMYIEIKIKNTCFDATINGGVRSGQVISNYGCASYYLDEYVHNHMNEFCNRANIPTNSFVIMFTDSNFNSIRLISLCEINNLLANGWNRAVISTFGADYGSRSYLIPIDATHNIDEISANQLAGYTSNVLSIPR